MPTSRKSPDRKSKLTNFKKQTKNKTKQKMSEVKANLEILKNPTWGTTDLFSISGKELEMLANYFYPYKDMISIVDRIITTAELQGKIKNELRYSDGTPVPVEDPRYKEIMEKEEQRINEWRKIVEERQKELADLQGKTEDFTKAVEAMEATVNNSMEAAETMLNEETSQQ